jgi:nitrite reductase/ring-hydroxylating ferredoxin subunit
MPRKPALSPCDGCSRRTVLQGLGLAALVPLVAACPSSNGAPTGNATTCSGGLCLDLADSANAALANVNGSVVIDSANDTIIVVRTTATTVIAVSAVCTHSGCLVDLEVSSSTLYCGCHGSRFAEDGGVITGPARRPLKVYTATLAGTKITITA